MALALARLRRHVVRRSLFAPGTLAQAVARLGFVQADPIRAPAPAQALILRHRVRGYRVGDLERAYPALGLDEDYLYAYGFATPATRRLLHPGAAAPPPGLEGAVLDFVRQAGTAHPRDVAARLAAGRTRNAWGGQSQATTRALEALHARGLVRVARRERGVRVYECAPPAPGLHEELSAEARLRGLILLLADLFAPLPEAALRRVLRYVPWVRRHAPAPAARAAVARLLREGALESDVLGTEPWVWPAGVAPHAPAAVPARVRLLAPFDPVVWDRGRFERLWGWAYRFEAYTPAARRERGYYALPLLWGADVVGWATAAAGPGGAVDVAAGFVRGRPRGAAFARAFDAEVERLRGFLAPR